MRIVDIVCKDEWIKDYEFFNEFKDSKYFDILLDTCENLNTDILFKSNVHGQDHIERVIFFALVLAWKYDLDNKDTDIIRFAACLHDTKRVNDTWDVDHGKRAASESIKYVNIDKDDTNILQAVIAAHSTDDKYMEDIIREYKVTDFGRALFLAKLFKDADGLDRVRIKRLDPAYLRNDFSKDLVDFAYILYEKYWLFDRKFII